MFQACQRWRSKSRKLSLRQWNNKTSLNQCNVIMLQHDLCLFYQDSQEVFHWVATRGRIMGKWEYLTKWWTAEYFGVKYSKSMGHFSSEVPELEAPPCLPAWLTWGGQVLHLCRDRDVCLGGQREAPSLPDALTHQRDVLLEAGRVFGQAQHGTPGLGQGRGLVLGAAGQAGPQEVGDGGVAALLPALRREERVRLWVGRHDVMFSALIVPLRGKK